MNRIILTGDIHADPTRLYTLNGFDYKLTKKDTVIVLGDFGLIWSDQDKTRQLLELLGSELNFTLAFIDGNHENFKLIRQMESLGFWNDGCVGVLPGGILHLLRGEIYNIDNKRVGVCGGANSVDLWHREKDVSWWAEEDITDKDIATFKTNLDNNKEIDIMLSHTCPSEILPQVALYSVANGSKVPVRNCEEKLEEINQMVNVKKWYFGHWHIDMKFDDKYQCIYRGFKEV